MDDITALCILIGFPLFTWGIASLIKAIVEDHMKGSNQ